MQQDIRPKLNVSMMLKREISAKRLIETPCYGFIDDTAMKQ